MATKELYLKVFTSTNDVDACRVMCVAMYAPYKNVSDTFYVAYDDAYDVNDEAFASHGIERAYADEHGITFDEYVTRVNDAINDANTIITFGGVGFDLAILARDFAKHRIVLNISKKFVYDACEIERVLRRTTFDETFLRRTQSLRDDDALSYDVTSIHAPSHAIDALCAIVDSQRDEIKNTSRLQNDCRASLQRLTIDNRVARDDAGFLIVTFGKNKSRRIVDLLRDDASYMKWLFDTSTIDTRVLIRDEYNRAQNV